MSNRNLSPELAAALAAAHVEYLFLVEFGWDSGTQYLTTAPFDIDWNGHTYVAAGHVGAIEPITETDSEARGLRLTLSGVPESAIAGALTEPTQGRSVVLRLGVVADGGLLVDPNVWKGTLDVPTIDDQAGPATITITAEHQLLAWQQPSGLLYSHEDQQQIAPGDMFFEFAAQMAEATVVWPDKSFFKR